MTTRLRFDPDLRSDSWGDPPIPTRFGTIRDHQAQAVDSILRAYDNGASVVLLDAPTGSGKSLIAELVRRALGYKRSLYCPDTITLQEQVLRDFGEYARLLKGRSNYPTGDYPEAFRDRWNPITAADCTKKMEVLPACDSCDRTSEEPVMHCRLCHPLPQIACPYEIAKRAALSSPLAVLNTSYFIAEANGPASFGYTEKAGTPKQFVIIDEADTLESTLMNQVEVFISAKRAKELGISPPAKKTVESSWVEWVEKEAGPKVARLLGQAEASIKAGDRSTETLRQYRYLSGLSGKLTLLGSALAEGNAVYDGYDQGDIRFQPVHVAPFGSWMVWRHAEKFLLMSASFVDAAQVAEDLGITRAGLNYEVVTVGSTFPTENRPIYVRNAANMVFKEKATEWPKMRAMVRKVLERHAGDRVLVHTVSYGFTEYMADGLRDIGRPVLLYSNAKERSSVLEEYKRLEGAVLLAPSMDRGIDLAGDLCRAVIVTKMPFANLKDKRVAARMYSHGGQRWFATQTIRTLIQMTGRGMRSADDACSTYLLDAQFANNLWKSNRVLFPKWWSDALDWTGAGL